MRLGGFEPPTRGLEGRRSSTELQARTERVPPVPADAPRPRRSTELLSEQRNDVVRVRIAPEHRLRKDELAVHVHVEDPVGPSHDLDDPDLGLPLLECPRHQTGGVRQRASGDAVLDAQVMAFGRDGPHLTGSVSPDRAMALTPP
jgi:hypothetical protein